MRAGGGGLMGLDGRTLLQFGASYPPYIFGAGQWWRLLTAGFLHGGLMHILFNSWALMDVGSHAEQIYGTPRMSSIYLLSTMGGFGASAIFTGSLSVGASAGLLGLIGAMIAYGMVNHGLEASMVKQFYVRWLVYILLMGCCRFSTSTTRRTSGGWRRASSSAGWRGHRISTAASATRCGRR